MSRIMAAASGGGTKQAQRVRMQSSKAQSSKRITPSTGACSGATTKEQPEKMQSAKLLPVPAKATKAGPARLQRTKRRPRNLVTPRSPQRKKASKARVKSSKAAASGSKRGSGRRSFSFIGALGDDGVAQQGFTLRRGMPLKIETAAQGL